MRREKALKVVSPQNINLLALIKLITIFSKQETELSGNLQVNKEIDASSLL